MGVELMFPVRLMRAFWDGYNPPTHSKFTIDIIIYLIKVLLASNYHSSPSVVPRGMKHLPNRRFGLSLT